MDAMSGRGELEDRGLVADFYGLGERAEYKIERTEVDGADSRADGADSIVLGVIQDWADWTDWGGRGGLADWRMQRSTESWTGRTGADSAD